MGNFGDELFLKTFKQIFHNHNVFPWSAFLDPNKIDAVIIGGGDLITPYYYNEYYFPSLLENHPTWIYGVGVVDHYNEDTWPIEQIDRHRQRLSKAKKVYLRDDNSARIFKKYFCTLSGYASYFFFTLVSMFNTYILIEKCFASNDIPLFW